MTATGVVCGSCGTEVSAMAKFYGECGAPVNASHPAAGDGAVRRSVAR
jgi:hypothetical protein